MKVIYYCSPGEATSAVAAAMHLGLISPDRFPSTEELGRLSFFHLSPDTTKRNLITFTGTDDRGHDVYIFAIAKEKDVIKKSIRGILDIFNKDSECIIIDTSYANNLLTIWGAKLPGTLGLYLYLKGIKPYYSKLAGSVRSTCNQLSRVDSLTSPTSW